MATWFDKLFLDSESLDTSAEVANNLAQNASRLYASGKISRDEYNRQLAEIGKTANAEDLLRGGQVGGISSPSQAFADTVQSQAQRFGDDIASLDVAKLFSDVTGSIAKPRQFTEETPQTPASKTLLYVVAIVALAVVAFYAAKIFRK